jgi:hypothetical protein
MLEIGWKHLGEVEQRQPSGHRKLKVHLYCVPPEWDSEHAEATSARVPSCPLVS